MEFNSLEVELCVSCLVVIKAGQSTKLRVYTWPTLTHANIWLFALMPQIAVVHICWSFSLDVLAGGPVPFIWQIPHEYFLMSFPHNLMRSADNQLARFSKGEGESTWPGFSQWDAPTRDLDAEASVVAKRRGTWGTLPAVAAPSIFRRQRPRVCSRWVVQATALVCVHKPSPAGVCGSCRDRSASLRCCPFSSAGFSAFPEILPDARYRFSKSLFCLSQPEMGSDTMADFLQVAPCWICCT